MYRFDRCVYLVDEGSEEQCGWRSCRSDRTGKRNHVTPNVLNQNKTKKSVLKKSNRRNVLTKNMMRAILICCSP